MKTTEVKNGSLIYQCGKPVNEIAFVKSGEVLVTTPSGSYMVEQNGILGICELASIVHYYTYSAASPVILERYEYSRADLDFFFDRMPNLADIAVSTGVEQVSDIAASYTISCMNTAEIYDFIESQYNEYCLLCKKKHIKPKTLGTFSDMTRPDSDSGSIHYMSGFYSIIRQITEGNIFVAQSDFLDGFIRHLCFDLEQILRAEGELKSEKAKLLSMIVGEERDDLLECYTSLLGSFKQGNEETKQIADAIMKIHVEINGHKEIDADLANRRVGEAESELLKLPAESDAKEDNTKLDNNDDQESEPLTSEISELSEAIDTILDYADCGADVNASFKSAISAFKLLGGRELTDDRASKLRHTISSLFYKIYLQAFQVSLGGGQMPLAVNMFLDFGFVDEELAGKNNTRYMAGLAEQRLDAPEQHIYTFYDWLLAIYNGDRMPSRNEFDQDFTDVVHEKRIKGEIDKNTEVRFLSDRAQMVVFELQNMFPSADKMTFGRITSFTGIFSENDVVGELPKSLITSSDIQTIIDDVREKDYSAFYRETIYSNPEVGINKDFIHKEIIPDVILMPVIGTRGVMWQEIEGKMRLSEGRIMLPIFMLEDLRPILLHTIGEFRWELCKRVQGSFWNDITDPSLTSEYFDYVQFYRKNQDLSQDMKDKLKASLSKAKNSYKEVFVRDYIIWIMFESEGLPRMNKVSRSILFKYCPFNREIRESLSKNPLYENPLRYFNLHNGQKKHHFTNVSQEIRNAGKEIPEEISDEMEYLNR